MDSCSGISEILFIAIIMKRRSRLCLLRRLFSSCCYFPVTIQINSDKNFRLNLFLSYLQRIAFLGELPGQRSRHESLRRPLIEPVRRHDVPNTFGSYESRDFRTRKNPSVNRLSTAVSGATACSCISLQRPEEQSILSGLQSRKQHVVFSLGKSVYRKGLPMTRHC